MAMPPAPTTAAELDAFLDTPAGLPPPGIIPDYINGEPNLTRVNEGIVSALFAIVTVVVALRMYSKIRIIKRTGREDWIALLAWASYIAFAAVSYLGTVHKEAWHQWNWKLRDLQQVLYWINVQTTVYCVVVALIKLSILFQYLDLFHASRKRDAFWWITWTMVIVVTGFYLASIVAAVTECTPRRKIWTPWLSTGSCVYLEPPELVSGALNPLIDIFIVALPQHKIWKLHTSFRQRMKISLVFAFGLFAIAASCVRLYYLVVYLGGHDNDLGYTFTKLGIWCHAEITAGFICSCLPSLRRIFKAATTKNTTTNPSALSWGSKIASVLRPSRTRKASTLPTPSSSAAQAAMYANKDKAIVATTTTIVTVTSATRSNSYEYATPSEKQGLVIESV